MTSNVEERKKGGSVLVKRAKDFIGNDTIGAFCSVNMPVFKGLYNIRLNSGL